MITFEKISTILIWSEDSARLAKWYQDIFNFKIIEELNHPQDTGVLFEINPGGTWLWIGQHSQVHGKNPDPNRHMFNLNVASVQEAYQYLLDKGVEFVAAPFKAPTMDRYFATFKDADDNLVQLIGGK